MTDADDTLWITTLMSVAEEEIERRPLHRDAPGVSDCAVRAVLHPSVTLDIPNGAVRPVLYGAVALYIRHRPVTRIRYLLRMRRAPGANQRQNGREDDLEVFHVRPLVWSVQR